MGELCPRIWRAQTMTILSTNPDYHNSEQQTIHQWAEKAFGADGVACLLKQELLSLEEEIGEGAFGKVYKGLSILGCLRSKNSHNNRCIYAMYIRRR